MTSREEEKRRRREARLAAEQAARAKGRRQNALRRTGAGVVALVLVGALAALIANKNGSSGQRASSGHGAATAVALPPPREHDLKTAAAKAGCVLRNFPNFGQQHTTDPVTYKSNPPTSGPHFPVPGEDGSYAAASPPEVTHSVHSLEHGRIEFQWRPGTPLRNIGQLQTLADEQGGYHVLLFANQTKMPYAVAATAWQHYIGCPKVTPAAFDALRDFRKTYTDKAPERIP